MNFSSVFRSGRSFKMSDLKFVALSLTTEYMSMDSESSLFKKLHNSQILNLIERSQFNKRRKKMFEFSKYIRAKLVSFFFEFEDFFVIDSMPLEICKKARKKRNKICKDSMFQVLPLRLCVIERNHQKQTKNE